MNVILNVYLFWGALQDIKRKSISATFIKVGIIIGIGNFFWEMYHQSFCGTERMWSMLPGLVFLMITKATKEKIGYGDGIVFLILGSCMDLSDIMSLWQISLLLSMFFSFFMVVIKKWNLHSQVAFVPFIWIAHVCNIFR